MTAPAQGPAASSARCVGGAGGPSRSRCPDRRSWTWTTKVRLLSGSGPWTTQPAEEIGLASMTVSDGPVGVRGGTDTELEPSAAFPSGSAMAATWDEDLLQRIGNALAAEAVRKGVDVVLGPTINLHRSPLGGRHFECMSEDPLLTGRLATAYVRGVQERGIGACPKHYVANDAETDRFTVDNRVDERTLRELYLAPFEAVVTDADPWMVMAAYNSVNGTAMTENDLLQEPLKGEWGFDGVVVSDWGALYDGEPAARAALDLTMPGPDEKWAEPLVEAVRAGRVPESAIDAKLRRLLRLAARTGALEGAAPAVDKPSAGRIEDASPLAREAAASAAVLLTQRRAAAAGPPSGCAASRCSAPVPGTPARWVAARRASRRRTWSRPSPASPPHSTGTPRWSPPSARPSPRRCGRRGPTSSPARRPGGRRRCGGSTRTGRRSSSSTPARRRSSASWPTPPRARPSSRSTPASLPDEDGDWRIGVVGRGSTALVLDGSTVLEAADSGEAFDIHEVFAAPPQYDTVVPLRAGQRVDVRIRYRWPAEGFIFKVGLVVGPPLRPADEELAHAVELARTSDVAVVVVGTSDAVESEGFDRTSLTLPGRQDELVRAVAAVNPRTVVVVNAGSPVELPWRDEVAAVLVVWFPGMEFGNALADVLTRRGRAGRPAAHHVAGGDGRRSGASRSRPPTGGCEYTGGPRHRPPRLPGEPAPSRPTGSGTASATRPGTSWRSRPRRGPTGDGFEVTRPAAQHRLPLRQARRAGLRLPARLRRGAAAALARRLRRRHRRARPGRRRAGRASTRVPCGTGTPPPAAGRSSPATSRCPSAAAPASCCASATRRRRRRDCRSTRPAGRAPRRGARHPHGGAAAVVAAARRRPRAVGLPDHHRQRLGHRLGRQRPEPARALRRPAAGLLAAGRVAGAGAHRAGGEPGLGAVLVRDRPAVGRGLAGVLGRARA